MAKLKIKDVKDAMGVAKEIQPFVEKYGPAVADKVAQRAKRVGTVAEGARDSVFGKIQQRKDAKEQKKAQEEARKRAVASALPPVSAKEFVDCFEAGVVNEGDPKTGYMAISGCYAILTLKSEKEKDLSAYKDVYVGCSDAIGFDVYSQLRGFGNVDVYADFKFKEPMRILFYPCDESQLEGRFAELVEDLQSVGSYNRWEAMAVAAQ